MIIYMLSHKRNLEYNRDTQEWIIDEKLIGFFSSMEKARMVVEALENVVGFMDYKTGFNIEEYDLPDDCLEYIYYAQHSFYNKTFDVDSIIEIGLFVSWEEAVEAAKQYEASAEIPVESHSWDSEMSIDNYLSIDKYVLDDVNWKEGFLPLD